MTTYGFKKNKCKQEVYTKEVIRKEFNVKYSDATENNETTIKISKTGDVIDLEILFMDVTTKGVVKFYNMDGTPFELPNEYKTWYGSLYKGVCKDILTNTTILEYEVNCNYNDDDFRGLAVSVSPLNLGYDSERTYRINIIALKGVYVADNVYLTD